MPVTLYFSGRKIKVKNHLGLYKREKGIKRKWINQQRKSSITRISDVREGNETQP